MVRSTCAYLGCATVTRRRPKSWHSARPLSVAAAALARERGLLHDQGHVIACVRHRKLIYGLLPSSAPLPPVPEPAAPLPDAISSSSSSSSSPSSAHNPSDGLPMAVLLSAVQLSMSTPAVVLQSALPAPQSNPHLPSATASVHPGVRPLAFTDRRAPTHPHAQVVHPRQQPRFGRALTGPQVEERAQQRQARRNGVPWRSKRAEREARSYARDWAHMEEEGGNRYTIWPLLAICALCEKTTCHSWDGEDKVQGGRPGCHSYMRLVGINNVIHDHICIRLECTGQDCGREVTISNQDMKKLRYVNLPATIRQSSFSSYILKLALFHLAAGCRTSSLHRVWELQPLSAMAMQHTGSSTDESGCSQCPHSHHSAGCGVEDVGAGSAPGSEIGAAAGEGGTEEVVRSTSTDAEGEAEEKVGEDEAEEDNEDGGRRSVVVEEEGVTSTGSGLVGREGALGPRGTGAIAYRLSREGRMGSTLSLHSGLRRIGIVVLHAA